MEAISADQFLEQFTNLSNLAQEVPQDAKAVDKQRIGSLLLSAVPLEGMAAHAYLTSEMGQAGLTALKTIGGKFSGSISDTVSDIADAVQSTVMSKLAPVNQATNDIEMTTFSPTRLTGAAGEVQDQILSAEDVADTAATNIAEQTTAAVTDAATGLVNTVATTAADVADTATGLVSAATDAAATGATSLLNSAVTTATGSAGSLAGAATDAAGSLAGAATDAVADVAGITASTVLDALGPVGAVVGVLASIGIALKDLFDAPKAPAPIFSAFQAGV